MQDLFVPAWFLAITAVITFALLIGARWNSEYQNVVRISGLTTMILGSVIVLVAVPFMSFGETSYIEQNELGEWVPQSDSLRLIDTASTETLIYVMSSFLIPVLLIGLITTRFIRSYPRLSAGLLWFCAFWLTAWVFPMITSVAWIVAPVALMAIVTAIFGTQAFKEQKQQQLGELRHYQARSS
jgi:hypothetical protein